MRYWAAILLVLLVSCGTPDTGRSRVAEPYRQTPFAEEPGTFEPARYTAAVVLAEGRFGSGVTQQYGNKTYVWTCRHVIENLKIGSDVRVWLPDIKNGVAFGYFIYDGKVVAYNGPDPAPDVGLVVIDRPTESGSARPGRGTPSVGTSVVFCGAPGSLSNLGLVGEGVISMRSRDQTFAYLSPIGGNSGGGVFTRDGRWVGIVSGYLKISNNYATVVSIEEIRTFAEGQGLGFLFTQPKDSDGSATNKTRRREQDHLGGGHDIDQELLHVQRGKGTVLPYHPTGSFWPRGVATQNRNIVVGNE